MLNENQLFGIIVACFWLYWGERLISNFAEEIEELPWWRSLVLQAILLLGAGFFCIEEMLEILIDWVIGDEEGEE